MLSTRQRKLLRALDDRKGREKFGVFLVEGPRLVADAHAAGWPIREAFVDPGSVVPEVAALAAALAAEGVPVTEVSEREMAECAGTVTPQGLLATAALPASDPGGALDGGSDVILVVEGVQDPGNLGALLRTADAYGVSPVLLLQGTADPLSPKAVRGSMGALFHIRVEAGLEAEATLEGLRRQGYRTTAAVARGGAAPTSLARGERRALLIGSEGRGLSEVLVRAADEPVTITTPGRAESLNVVVATGVLLDRMVGSGRGNPPVSAR